MKQYLDMCKYVLENGENREIEQEQEHVVFLDIKLVMI